MEQNPGLSNPEISKIIGRQWKALADVEREKWNALARVRARSVSKLSITHYL